MKFAKYLKDHQIVEWNKEYIDYRGLKKLISAVREAENATVEVSEEIDDDNSEHEHAQAHETHPAGKYGSFGSTPPYISVDPLMSVTSGRVPPILLPDAALDLPVAAAHASTKSEPVRDGKPVSMSIVYSIPESIEAVPPLRPRMIKSQAEIRDAAGTSSSSPSSTRFLAGFRRRYSVKSPQSSPSLHVPENQSLAEFIPKLTPSERKCIVQLDKELEKVNKFYKKLEKDAMLRDTQLTEQLHALENHEVMFKEYHNAEAKWHTYVLGSAMLPSISKGRPPKGKEAVTGMNGKNTPRVEFEHTRTRPHNVDRLSTNHSTMIPTKFRERDPEEYRVTRKLLKKAVWEYHRLLELILEYRALNIAGFSKALKKFDKVSNRGISDKYIHEKVEECEIYRNQATIENMKTYWASQFAKYFMGGDEKKARARLRPPTTSNSHHISVFRTGIYLGACLPALADGLYESFQEKTRQEMPWDGLLLVYATFAIPLVFLLLVGTNVLVWSKARINHILIFDLVRRRKIDSQQFFELPAFLFSTLVFSFWFSFKGLGTSLIASTTWPLIWLVFALLLVFNPLPMAFGSSRWWLIRKMGKLLVSGTKPVEFTDFWLGDQFCSLIFSLSNFYFVGCVYHQRWNNIWDNCSSSEHWGLPFALASLPLSIRAIQCIKRYADVARTNRDQHSAAKPFFVRYRDLINAGKYSTTIVYYGFYYQWRHHHLAHDYSFPLYIFFATIYSVYTCLWDIYIDWALLKHDGQRVSLRSNLLYSRKLVYYFAIFSNIILRFMWIIYIPGGSFNINLRSFMSGCFEMLRRWQWNFFRLEAEQLGNVDMYAAVKDVRLPYDAAALDDDDEYEEYELRRRNTDKASLKSLSSNKSRTRTTLPTSVKIGHLPEDDDP